MVVMVISLAVLTSGTAALGARLWRTRSRRSTDDVPEETVTRQRLNIEEWRDGELVDVGTVIADARDPLGQVDDVADRCRDGRKVVRRPS
jgi:hypothetical protein